MLLEKWQQSIEGLPIEPEFGLGRFPVEKLVEAPWNFKVDDLHKALTLFNGIKKNTQIVNMIVRPLGNGKYEVVDGNHRIIAMRDLKYEWAVCFNRGYVSEEEAMEIALTLENRFEYEETKLSRNISQILKKQPLEDLAAVVPFTQSQLLRFQEVADYDWSKLDGMGRLSRAKNGDNGFVKMKFLVPVDAEKVIRDQIKRVKELCGYTGPAADGLALEKICAEMSATPDASLE